MRSIAAALLFDVYLKILFFEKAFKFFSRFTCICESKLESIKIKLLEEILSLPSQIFIRDLRVLTNVSQMYPKLNHFPLFYIEKGKKGEENIPCL